MRNRVSNVSTGGRDLWTGLWNLEMVLFEWEVLWGRRLVSTVGWIGGEWAGR